MSELYDKTYNPDVLSCLANLSNDEVFTPPEIANQMLDMLSRRFGAIPTRHSSIRHANQAYSCAR